MDDQVAGATTSDAPASDDAAGASPPDAPVAPSDAPASAGAPEAAPAPEPAPSEASPSEAAPSEAGPTTPDPAPHDHEHAHGDDVHAHDGHDHDAHDHADDHAAPPHPDDPQVPHADVPGTARTLPVPMPPDLPPPGDMPALAPPRPPGPRDTLPAPPHPQAPPGPDPVVLERLDDLGRRIEELARLGTHRRELVDELHADNQRLRAGELAQAQAPLLRDLVRLHDDVERLEAAAGDGAADLGLVRQQLLQVLDRAGVRRFEVTAGEPFDGTRHQGVRSVPTTDGAADRSVAAMVRCGFERDDGRVLRPADVEVHRAASG